VYNFIIIYKGGELLSECNLLQSDSEDDTHLIFEVDTVAEFPHEEIGHLNYCSISGIPLFLAEAGFWPAISLIDRNE
jgi:hypothetical protein